MKVLLVEDDSRTAEFILKGLKQQGWTVEHATDGNTGLTCALYTCYDAAVIDIMLPSRDGLSLIKEIRNQKVKTPVLILSARKAVDSRVQGLEIGADDYLVKPFAFSELVARLQALVRRTTGDNETTNNLSAFGIMIDVMKRRVYCNDQELTLQPKEYLLLEYLMRNRGRIVSKTMIMENVWDYNFDPHTNVVEARICHLREKLLQMYPKQLIHTIRGMGYLFEERD